MLLSTEITTHLCTTASNPPEAERATAGADSASTANAHVTDAVRELILEAETTESKI